MGYCKKCGAEIVEQDQIFCHSCGDNLKQQQIEVEKSAKPIIIENPKDFLAIRIAGFVFAFLEILGTLLPFVVCDKYDIGRVTMWSKGMTEEGIVIMVFTVISLLCIILCFLHSGIFLGIFSGILLWACVADFYGLQNDPWVNGNGKKIDISNYISPSSGFFLMLIADIGLLTVSILIIKKRIQLKKKRKLLLKQNL